MQMTLLSDNEEGLQKQKLSDKVLAWNMKWKIKLSTTKNQIFYIKRSYPVQEKLASVLN